MKKRLFRKDSRFFRINRGWRIYFDAFIVSASRTVNPAAASWTFGSHPVGAGSVC